jgi:general secretion pathway protein D
MPKSIWKTSVAALALACTLGGFGCAGERAFRQGRQDELLEHWDRAVLDYSRAREQNPGDLKSKMAFDRVRRRASQDHFEKGKMYLNSGRPDMAIVELEQAVALDTANDYAALDLARARELLSRQEADKKKPTKTQRAEQAARNARATGPILEPSSRKPISLNFPQPRPIKQIYQALAQAAGINVIFDPALKDDQVTIVLSNVAFQNALETLIRQENHFYKVIDTHTILLAADTPANRKTYEDLVIRTFYLSNGDVTETANAIRALLGTVHVSTNKAENAITVRDTADKISIAQRIIEQNDKEKAEVVVDVELLEITADKSQDLGPFLSLSTTASVLPSGAVGTTGATGTTGSTGTTGLFTWDFIRNLSINNFGFTIPSVTLKAIKTATNAQVLARPQLRISEGEKAQLTIGDKVPIPTTTLNTQFAQGNGAVVPITSFQYQDVGIKIEMEPRVHHNREVTLKMTIEVSNLNGKVTQNGQDQPIIGTRTISSTIRLKDGETNFLAGLFRVDKTNTSSETPFLSDIPLLGRLFSGKSKTQTERELVMTVTPHIIRVPDINEQDLLPVFVGTENNISYQGTPRVESFNEGQGPFDGQKPARPTVPDRRRTTNPAPTPQPGGTVIAPGGMPSDPFAPKPTPPPPGPPRTPQAEPGSPDAPAARFEFNSGAVTLAPGEETDVLVMASGGEALGNSALFVNVDPQIASVESIEPLGGSESHLFSASCAVVSLGAGVAAGTPHPVARVRLKGVAPGSSRLTLDGSALLDGSSQPAQGEMGETLVVVR